MSIRTISVERARRIALGAQGFADPRPSGQVDVRHFRRVLNRVNIVQLDSVNVLARAHYMPFYSRLGAYSRSALDRWLWRSGEMFEYWAHEASLIPISDRALFTHRMQGGWHWPGVERLHRDHPDLVEQVLEAVRSRGRVQVGDLDQGGRTDKWWGWSNTKMALEWLFLTGQLTVVDRPNFTRIYDLPERVHPHALHGSVDEVDARKAMLRKAVRALGVGTSTDLTDYYRMRRAGTLVTELAEAGDLVPVRVEGWKDLAYLDPQVSAPRVIPGAGFLSPFDPVTWCRPRTERLFGFHYRIEIYTPAPKRVFGYYVLPFRVGDALVGRADLKADRAQSRLLVQAAYHEDQADPDMVADHMAAELEGVAAWLGLSEVVISGMGNIGQRLKSLNRSKPGD